MTSCLQPHVLPLMQRLPGAIFQQDNSRPHTTRLSPHCYYPSLACPIPRFVSNQSYLGSFGTVSWASREFERIRGKLQKIWNEISQNIIQNLYGSMPDRIASCIRARGGSTGDHSSHGILVVNISDLGWHVTSPSPVPLKTCRVEQKCTLNMSRAQMSSRWCGVVFRRMGCQLRCRPRHLTMIQNYEVRCQKP
ncbi:uncharacterized protein TNCV_107481 [Trichonephila clavipes]|nr:uncharacterized protein TNCV_107481 [Trichonephila clavipes]